MPYTTTNDQLFRAALLTRWFNVENVCDLVDALMAVDYSVTASRREGHAALNKLMTESKRGRDIFNRATRFPDDDAAVYLARIDPSVDGILTSLGAVLSYRTTNEAKDTQAGTGNAASSAGQTRAGNGQDYRAVANDQAVQDNTKRFEELTKQLSSYTTSALHLYDRHKTERDLSLTWAA